jgi:hypothetical protein
VVALKTATPKALHLLGDKGLAKEADKISVWQVQLGRRRAPRDRKPALEANRKIPTGPFGSLVIEARG